MRFLQKLGLAEAICLKCGFTTMDSYMEMTHNLKHNLDSLNCSTEAKKLIALIDREFEFGNTDDAERIINEILEIMGETERLKIVDVFEIVKKGKKIEST